MLPPCFAVTFAVVLIGTVNLVMAATLVALAIGLGAVIYMLARSGTLLHRSYAGPQTGWMASWWT